MAAKVGRDQHLWFLPHKDILIYFLQFCQVIILYIVFIKIMDKTLLIMGRQMEERMSSEYTHQPHLTGASRLHSP